MTPREFTEAVERRGYSRSPPPGRCSKETVYFALPLAEQAYAYIEIESASEFSLGVYCHNFLQSVNMLWKFPDTRRIYHHDPTAVIDHLDRFEEWARLQAGLSEQRKEIALPYIDI